MDAYRARDIMSTIDEAIAAWTLHVGTVPDEFTIGALAQHTDRLGRALSRLSTLAVTHPGLTVVDVLPRGAVDAAELEEIGEITAAELKALTAQAPSVRLMVRSGQCDLLDEFDHHVRDAVRPLVVREDGTQYLDVTDVVEAALHFDPEAEAVAALQEQADEEAFGDDLLRRLAREDNASPDEEELEESEDVAHAREQIEKLRRRMGGR